MTITGKIIAILERVSGGTADKSWTKQEFIIETTEKFPKKVCICAWKDQIEELVKYKQGDNITAHINLESREYNGKWYTNVQTWKIEGTSQEPTNKPISDAGQATHDVDELPF